MKLFEYNTVIIGSGAAGLFAALKISKRQDFDGKILIVTKCPFGESNSRYAQGGIAAAINSNIQDSVLLHINDTLKSGVGLCDENVVKLITENAENVINELVSINAGFDCDEFGKFKYTLGGAHSAKRVLHSGEDSTGTVMINALCNVIKNSPNIDILQKTMAVELIVSEAKICQGLVVFNNNTKEHEIIYSKNIVLATGGAGQVYKYTTNPYGATGDGIALAYQAGAEIQDIEFVQFHPTALAINSDIKNRYLISEAMRGEGAKLINNHGEEFMSKYSEQKELAGRDVVSRAIISEMEKENKPNVFLTSNEISAEIVLKRFPSIAKKCLASGIDITKNPIPVAPAAHYMIGGVKAKPNGQTSIQGLYVIGELASTGFHGANRLASNSLLECIVCAEKLAQDINLKEFENKNISTVSEKKYEHPKQKDNNDYQLLKNKLKDTMWNKVGIIRNEESLTDALQEIAELKHSVENISCFSGISGYEFRNLIITAELITKCALARKESRGAHYRSDYPNTTASPQHSCIKMDDVSRN